ncbi:MAG: nicotinate (nicotinamide) nucleotide adenylyltransferase [Chlorobia bacterium]|nr:nicotinate (nicotinamide) nucleotide adenylyltransferase [Fimbriimonadaceae bacterium]
MRIGILGGTFDPPHLGHMALAETARQNLNLDEVIWMPAFQNPLKTKIKSTPAKHRLEMVKLAIADKPGMAFSDSEISRRGSSYTVDTISELQHVSPAEYWFIVGADSLRSMTEWKQPERLLKLCRIAAAVRPPINSVEALLLLPPHYREDIDLIEMKPLDISATEIRTKVIKGQSIGPWVSKSVIKYIEDNKLYRI